ncbi:MAG: nucleotidyltransferase family protein [Polyangiaceae bacterium]
MILAAGLGTRLAPLTDFRAKALMPLGDKPLLAHLVTILQSAGFEKIAANAHHRADEIEAFARENLRGIAISREADLLGTAGGVHHARALLGEGDVLIWNGDIVADLDPRAVARMHEKSENEATLAIVPRARGESNVGIDAHGHVVRLRKETTAEGEIEGGEFLGVHVVGRALRETLPEAGCLVGDVYVPALRRGAKFGVMRYQKKFQDIGTLESYLEANLAWLRSSGRRVWLGENARIERGVDAIDALVGAGGSVSGKGKLERVVVWPNAHAVAPLEDAIVTTQSTVRVARVF